MKLGSMAWRIPLGIIGGGLGFWAFPTENLWIIAPLIPAVILIATLGLGFWKATLIGFIAGQAFYISHIEWISLYLGPVPLIGLSTLCSIPFALGSGLTAWLYDRKKPKGLGVIRFAFAAAGIWTLKEWSANNFPYGGFPWSRLAMTQSDSVFANWVYWGGLSLLSFVIALLGSLIALTILNGKKLKSRGRLAMVGVAGLSVLVPLITPIGITTQAAGTLKVAAVQGNANAGLFSNLERGTILQNHLDATELVFENFPDEKIDLLVWPENASDLDPSRSEFAREKISEVADRIDAPFIFGTITQRDDESFNSTILWEPGVGPTDYYDKQVPVPFAEYVPDREFWRALAPDLVDLVPRGFSFGTRDGIFEVPQGSVGSLICFEIAEDSIPRTLTTQGARLILSQTNNADFGYSDETFQQAAIARLRAIETGRTVVNISTVGLSVIYLPDGKILDELTWYTPAVMVQDVPLYDGLTPATTVGFWFDLLNGLLVALSVGAGFTRVRRR
jgi:apolipoprotein N-acyltransferase